MPECHPAVTGELQWVTVPAREHVTRVRQPAVPDAPRRDYRTRYSDAPERSLGSARILPPPVSVLAIASVEERRFGRRAEVPPEES
jgi:hypothetical protein